jgi:ABC-type uncharacterized transport system permease subunit
MQTFKKYYRYYKRAAWYLGVFLAEIDQVLQVGKIIGMAAVALAFIHIIFPLSYLIIAGLGLLLFGIGIGVFLVKSGSVEIATELGNEQNKQFQEVLEKIREIHAK